MSEAVPAPAPRAPATRAELDALQAAWMEAWPQALAVWSRFTRLRPPRWCLNQQQEQDEGLTGSFAMIRLKDIAVVISLRQVAEKGLEGFAVEVLAHEIGHHVLAPADLTANARAMARIQAGLPGQAMHAPMISNLYTDLLINDRLQRQAGLDVAGVYRTLGTTGGDTLWRLYMRTYERLWQLPKGTLTDEPLSERMESDAGLAARLVRVYGRDWLGGAGRFAALCLPYLPDQAGGGTARERGWLDAVLAGVGGRPSGLSELDPDEQEGALHPALDPLVSGLSKDEIDRLKRQMEAEVAAALGRETVGGQKSHKGPRGPVAYGELLKAVDGAVTENEAVRLYYRERAQPHLVPFPSRRAPKSTEPQLEGLDAWTLGDPLQAADWVESVFRSPFVVPGVTTVQRAYGDTEGHEPERKPVDLYLGVDCSGSMPNPRLQESYPVVAGAIVTLSALRAGARAMAVLSGEPGRTIRTEAFERDERAVMDLLTSYLGTGSAFGIHRLAETFDGRTERDRPVHILLLTDHDLFWHLGRVAKDGVVTGGWAAPTEAESVDPMFGWNVAERALRLARGGGTIVMNTGYVHPDEARLEAMGWNVHHVAAPEDLVTFARAFSRATYAAEEAAER